MKRLLIVAMAALLAALMATGAWAFTVQVLPDCDCTSDNTFTFKVIVETAAGESLSDVKVQGGTSGWTTFLAYGEEGSCTSESVVLPPTDTYPNPRPNKIKIAKGKNTRVACFFISSLGGEEEASQEFKITVTGDPAAADEDCPNVNGHWSASATNSDGESVEAQARDMFGTELTKDIQVWNEDLQNYETINVPETNTPELTTCDFVDFCAAPE
jgi:hypothetical protein